MAEPLTYPDAPPGPVKLRLQPVETSKPEAAAPERLSRRRARLFGLLGAAVALGAVAWGAHWFLVDRHYVSTDNAYVGADTAAVTPRVGGAVTQVLVSDTQPVKAGQVLVVIDDADARLAVANAQAALGQAERKVRAYFADSQTLGGQLQSRQADLDRAQAQIVSSAADVERAQVELKRRKALAASGAVSGDELTDAQNRLDTALAAR